MSTLTTTITTTTTPSSSPSPILASPIKKKTMSLTQTYYLAHKARAKLSNEAAMPDHNLRLLVGHANLLDGLMLELADAEREQESWFNQSVRNAQQQQHHQSQYSDKNADDRHIQWADTIEEDEHEDEDEDDYSDSSSEEDSDFESEDVEMADVVSLRRVPSNYHLASPPSPKMEIVEVDMDDDDDEEEEDYEELTLTRSPSHTIASPPPELENDEDESSEDESMPPSPPSAVLPTFDNEEKQSKESPIAPSPDFYEEGYYLPARNPTRLVSSISVY